MKKTNIKMTTKAILKNQLLQISQKRDKSKEDIFALIEKLQDPEKSILKKETQNMIVLIAGAASLEGTLIADKVLPKKKPISLKITNIIMASALIAATAFTTKAFLHEESKHANLTNRPIKSPQVEKTSETAPAPKEILITNTSPHGTPQQIQRKQEFSPIDIPNNPTPMPVTAPIKPTVLPAIPYNTEVIWQQDNIALAPFTIKTSGSSGHYVKLVEVGTNREILKALIKPNETLTTEVPLGNYEIRYASGKQWYGTRELFGPATEYAKTDRTFRFAKTTTGYTGWTIELYLQVDGNLSTSKIRKDQF